MAKKNYKTVEEWRAEGKRLFGGDFMKWRFKCPRCGNVATVQEFKDAGAKGADAACTCCIGRYVSDRGCDCAAFGLLDICDVHVNGQPVFEFAPDKNGGEP